MQQCKKGSVDVGSNKVEVSVSVTGDCDTVYKEAARQLQLVKEVVSDLLS